MRLTAEGRDYCHNHKLDGFEGTKGPAQP
jgi:hypothetical protein